MSAKSFPVLPSPAPVESAMSTSSLPALPVEIITEIFKSTDDFSTATALSRTCRGLHSVWKSNTASICYALLVRTIPCYDQAFQYVQVQHLDIVSSGLLDATDSLAIEATEQFLENAEVAHAALQLYETQMIKRVSKASEGGPWPIQNCPSPRRLTEAQRGYFLKAWYRLHTLASLPSDPLPYSILASLDRLELEQMRDVLRWLWDELPAQFRLMHEGGHRFFARFKSHIAEKQWHELEGRLNSLSKELPGELFRRYNYWRFILHEVYLDNEESGKGDSLADKLPPMDKQDTSHHFIDSFHGFVFRGAK